MIGTRLQPPPRSVKCEPSGRLPFALGSRAFVLLAVGLLWLMPAWLDRRAVAAMLLWDALVLAAAAVDFRRMSRPGDLTIVRRWSSALTLGVPAAVELELRNDGGASVDARLTDYVSGTLRVELAELHLTCAGGAAVSGSYDVRPRERGDADVGPVAVRWQSAWRLAERRGAAPLLQTVRVYPDLQEGRRESLHLIRSRQVAVEKRRAHRTGLGREFESLRDYQPGDERRDICWTAAARRGHLVTKVYRPERSQPVWILIDAGRLLRARTGGQTVLDHAVTAAVTLAQVAMSSGDKVGVLAYGRRIQRRLPPGRGPSHLRDLVEALATVRAEGVEADHAGAAAEMLRIQKRRSLVVWLTEIAETAGVPDVIEQTVNMVPRHVLLFAVMQHQQIRALASAAPSSAGDMYRVMAAQETVERRDGLLQTLRQRGALVLEGSPMELSGRLVDRYLEVKERGLL